MRKRAAGYERKGKKVRNGRVRESTRGRKPCVVCSGPQSRGGKNRRLERGGKRGKFRLFSCFVF